MKSFKVFLSLLSTIAVLAVPIGLVGCSGGCARNLAPGGAYSTTNAAGLVTQDTALYTADKTIVESYDVLHAFVKFEFENRAALQAASPQVKIAADNVRKNARKWTDSAIASRDVYAASPTPENRNALNDATRVLREAITQAQSFIKSGVPKAKQPSHL